MFYNSLVKTRMEMALLVMQKKKSVWFCHKHDWTYPEVSLRKPSLGSLERFPAFDEKEKKRRKKKKTAVLAFKWWYADWNFCCECGCNDDCNFWSLTVKRSSGWSLVLL